MKDQEYIQFEPDPNVTQEQIDKAHQIYLEEEAAAKHVTSYVIYKLAGKLLTILMGDCEYIGQAEFDPVSKWVTVTRAPADNWPDVTGLRHKIDYQEPDGESVIHAMQLCAQIESNNMRLDNIMQHRETISEIVDTLMEK